MGAFFFKCHYYLPGLVKHATHLAGFARHQLGKGTSLKLADGIKCASDSVNQLTAQGVRIMGFVSQCIVFEYDVIDVFTNMMKK